MSIELKLDRSSENTVTVSVNGDIDMNSSTKVRDVLAPLFEENNKAIEEYKLALRKNPKDTFALYNLAVVYQDQGKNDQAIELYQDVLKQTEDTSSRINLASIQYLQGKREEAFAQLKTAAKKNPDSAHALSILGKL